MDASSDNSNTNTNTNNNHLDKEESKEHHPHQHEQQPQQQLEIEGEKSFNQTASHNEKGSVVEKELFPLGSPKSEAEAGHLADGSPRDASLERIPEEPVFDGTERSHEESQQHREDRQGFPGFDFAKKSVDWPEKAAALKSFVMDRKEDVSNAIRRLSDKIESLGILHDKESSDDAFSPGRRVGSSPSPSGLEMSTPDLYQRSSNTGGPKMKGRITLFTKSGCQDSRAARSFLRSKGLSFVEINIDVFPQRKLELEERTGTASAPQVFFNESFLGGTDEILALERKDELDEKLKEVFENECPETAPQPPVYGENDPENSKFDDFTETVTKLKTKIVVKDRFHKMRLFSKCFVGSEAVDVIAEERSCSREEAVLLGRELAAKHFFHHVLQENTFEDGNHLYRFLEDDPVVLSKCFNFHTLLNIMEPASAADMEANLRKFTHALIDSYVSDDGKHVDYQNISMSEEFRRYVRLTEGLQRIDLSKFAREEKLAFFINLYNIMTIHAIVLMGHPSGPLDRRRLFGDFQYVVGGHPYSLSAIQNGILRGNQRPPYQLIKPFGPKDRRLAVALPGSEPLIHFALTTASKSSPALKCYSPSSIDGELRAAVRAFLLDGGVLIDMDTKTISLSKILKWYSVDFGKTEIDILRWLVNHLEPNKAENLLELLDGNQFKVVYQPYDWTPNL